MKSATDNKLLGAWVRGRNADAFDELTHRYAGLVYSAALRILNNPSDAEDVAQSCFETLALTDRPPQGALAPWLHRVATNRALDLIRTSHHRADRERAFAEEQEPHVEIVWDDIYTQVDEAINDLPEELRTVLVERYYASRSVEEIARSMGIHRRTVYHRCQRGIELVRDKLHKRGLPVAATALAALLSTHLALAAALPASLSIKLGHLAVAGITTPGAPLTISGLATTGGLLIMKKGAIGALVLIIAGLGLWRYLNPPLPPATPAPTHYVSLSEADTPETTTQAPEAATTAASVDEAAPDAARAAQGGAISGRLFNRATGEGVPGLRPRILEIADGLATENEVQTAGEPSDANGNYRAANLTPGNYAIAPPVAPQYPPLPPAQMAFITVQSGTEAQHVDFALDPGAKLSGLVLSRDGTPVSGATVLASSDSYTPYEAHTSSTGEYTMYLPQVYAVFSILARKDTMQSPRTTATLAPDTRQDLILSEPANASISGRVVDDRDRPIAGAQVAMIGTTLYPPEHQRSTASDGNGEYHFSGLAAGRYGLDVAAPGGEALATVREPQQTVTLSAGRSIGGVNLSVGPNLSLAGHVVDGHGHAVSGARVIAASIKIDVGRSMLDSYGRGESDKTGAFFINGLKPGEFKFEVLPPGQMAQTPLEGTYTAGSDDIKLLVEIPETVRLRGQVIDAETGAPITAFLLGGFMQTRRFLHPEGRFEVEAPIGKGTISVEATGYAGATRDVEISASSPAPDVVLALKVSGMVEGQVVDTRGNGIAGANIFWGAPRNIYSSSQWLCRTDSQGFFTANTIPASTRVLTAANPNYPAQEKPIAPKMRFVLEAGAMLRGQVTSHGQPVYWTYFGIAQHGKGIPNLGGVTDIDGMYRVLNIGPGGYELEVTFDRTKTSVAFDVKAGETKELDVEIDLGGSTLQGQITGFDHPEHVTMTLNVATANGSRQYRSRGGEDGHYQIDGIVAGTGQLEVEARRQGASPILQSFSLEIPENKEITQDIQFSAGSAISGAVAGIASGQQGVILALQGEIDLPATITVEEVQAALPQIEALRAGYAACDGAGTYQLDGLAPGTYTLVAVSQSAAAPDDITQWAWSSAVIVIEEDGQTFIQDFDLR